MKSIEPAKKITVNWAGFASDNQTSIDDVNCLVQNEN